MKMKLENKKTKVMKSVNRIGQDYLPTQIDATPEMLEKIKRTLNIEQCSIDQKLDNHIKYVFLDDKVRIDKENGIQYDNWGVGWDLVLTEGFHIRNHPLLDWENLMKYRFPAATDNLFSSIHSLPKNIRNEYFILFDQGWTLFERLWLLRGFENTLVDLYCRKREMEYLLDGITEYNIEIAKKISKIGYIDGAYTGDDFGTQRGMILSPDMWKKFFKKRYKNLWEVYRSNHKTVFHHSCGNIIDIIPQLIDLGLNVLTPIQPEAMDISELSRKYGSQLSFLGGISTQSTLPYGTPENVKKEVAESIKILGKHNGYIISPAHEITSDCPEKNFLALNQALSDYRSGEFNIV
jgi:uroporphyrinogen decarboxylase